VSLARFAFQACLIDRSSISPFRINNLRAASLIIAPFKFRHYRAILFKRNDLTGPTIDRRNEIVIDLVISRDYLRRLSTDPA
jgi:hypothetical protein